MNSKLSVVVFISGRGSNLAGLLAKQKNYAISAVISNNPEAAGLQIAKEYDLPVYLFDRKSYSSLVEMKAAVRDRVAKLKPDLIALAGYMQIIEAEFIELFANRIVNIHPSLLPKYRGLDTHKRVIADKEHRHGCTVHLVDSGLDTGAVISQVALNVEVQDDEASLSQRVLQLEHQLYPWTVNGIGSGDIKLKLNQAPEFSAQIIASAEEAGFTLGDNANG